MINEPRALEARDTIAAISTAPGRAAIAVLRISGSAAGAVLDRIAGGRPEPRVASFRALRYPETGELLDRGLALWFPGPASATGEDAAELHLHGGRAVVAAVLEAVLAVEGVRAAEPGEFTRRAFLAGKLDLAETEGLADLIDAETQAQRRQAIRQSEGALSAIVDGWRDRLIAAMALVEAGIDFSDEDDVPAAARAQARSEIALLARDLDAALADTRAERLREGFRIAIVGAPNAGKSSLLNALARREAAIVADGPGTTRDVVEVHLDLDGYPAIVADTAGLRATDDAVEREGVRRATAQAADADLVLWLRDPASPDGMAAPLTGGALWTIASKADLTPALLEWADRSISTRTGAGLDDLVAALGEAARSGLGDDDHVGLTRARHRDAIRAAGVELRAALDQWEALPDEFLAERLRRAATELGRIAGRVGVEDVLDRLFASFCIGK
ncbi:tRNA modification GTPase [Methylopila capsulata]|uniref:tRNA modification GTPase MnmE n=1 Tax=Methylopila capsulata TaxID=61654 RepID=A0A9W6IQZ3_9HYPH|nr:tRNA uridine-5-carboxymethylaminomethyl(34) synthesis GTPase MnmE [Methylopila capsulata]MBM7851837.1 tRNA modification GTPase [Methylopila capsulata]GLK54902.1 tRNA modification GTPase MnmE [Methylopila capsulata]